jgi:hypothetical protein
MSNNTLTVVETVNAVTVTPIKNTVTVSSVGVQGAIGPVTLPVIPTGYYLRSPSSGSQGVTPTTNRTNFNLIYISSTQTFDRLAIRTGGAFNGSAIVRLGIYNNDNATGRPSTVVLDAGTVNPIAANTIYQITISQSLNAGFYWIVSNVQSAATNTQLLGSPSAATEPFSYTPWVSAVGSSFFSGYGQNSVTGAFATVSSLITPTSIPLTFLRAV